MRYTLCVTLQCNMACSYCYISHGSACMSRQTAAHAVDFIYRTTPEGQPIEIGFFGGEPLLHFGIVETLADLIQAHEGYAGHDVSMTLATNGTLLTETIVRRFIDRGMYISVSCDGPAETHDRFRRFTDGSPTSVRVGINLKALVAAIPGVMVNAVYRPETLMDLAGTVDYFSSLGIRRIYLSPDYSARWTGPDIAALTAVYGAVGEMYCAWVRRGDPHYISLIDGKIPVVLRGGYRKHERCSMGEADIAISPQGNLFPCERLLGDGADGGHCIGTLETGTLKDRISCFMGRGNEKNNKCAQCELQKYCMHWCGCSNYFATGYYNRVSEFLCASERAALETVMNVIEYLKS